MDVRRAYAYVDGRWVECWCSELRAFGPVSEREIEHLSAEMRQRLRLHRGHARRNSLRVADFVDNAAKQQEVLLQARRDAASRAAESGMPPTGESPEVAAGEGAASPGATQGIPSGEDASPRSAETGSSELELFDAYV